VDTIAKCRDCAYRYLCGGACRAWGNRNALDLNAAPVQCDHLKQRAQSLINAAREYLEIRSKINLLTAPEGAKKQ
jgi:uncharacterized protein